MTSPEESFPSLFTLLNRRNCYWVCLAHLSPALLECCVGLSKIVSNDAYNGMMPWRLFPSSLFGSNEILPILSGRPATYWASRFCLPNGSVCRWTFSFLTGHVWYDVGHKRVIAWNFPLFENLVQRFGVCRLADRRWQRRIPRLTVVGRIYFAMTCLLRKQMKTTTMAMFLGMTNIQL